MKKVCINTRDELLILDLDKIAYFQANGNYTRLTYISGQALALNMGLSGVEKLLSATLAKGTSSFVRLGRSLIINENYLSNINLLKQYLVLSDIDSHQHKLPVSKALLKLLKEKFTKRYAAAPKAEGAV
ncbi:MAG: LytTR family transcriptional regulator DNA-binding domain-containing protein [Muribaculaceae bacterium]